MTTRWCAALAVGAALLLAGEASAAPNAGAPDIVEARLPPTRRVFYGWENAAVGEVGALLTSAALVLPDRLLSTAPSAAAFIVGVPTFLLGSPIVHWSHGYFGKGVVSLAANAALPLVSGLTGRAIACRGEARDDCAYRGFGTGFALTAIVLPLVDALVLGWDDVPVDDLDAAEQAGRGAATFAVVPTVDRQGRFAVELTAGGRF